MVLLGLGCHNKQDVGKFLKMKETGRVGISGGGSEVWANCAETSTNTKGPD